MIRINNRIRQKDEKSNITKIILITISILFISIMLIIPMIVLVLNALHNGFEAYKNAVFDEYTIKALYLTILATTSAVFVNTFFGLFAAWTITKFKFHGKQLLTTLIDIPFAISPVIAGLVFILTFGRIGWMNDLLEAMDIKIVFAVPGIILATIFVTFPFISRELIPVLNAQGNDEEEAAAIMGQMVFLYLQK